MTYTALITGASAGLGQEFAKLFAADGHNLVLVARRKDRLDTLAAELREQYKIRVDVLADDLADPHAAIRIVGKLETLGLSVDFLVNNAGFGASGAVADIPLARELDMLSVNISTVVSLTRALVPEMVKRRFGRVLNVGSTAGFLPGPFMAVYYASKAFVNSFSEALWYELKGTGVTVTASCPGATATEFSTVAGTGESRLFRMGTMSAEEVARQAYGAMHAGRPLIVHGLKNKVSIGSLRFAPRPLVRALAARLNRTADSHEATGGA